MNSKVKNAFVVLGFLALIVAIVGGFFALYQMQLNIAQMQQPVQDDSQIVYDELPRNVLVGNTVRYNPLRDGQVVRFDCVDPDSVIHVDMVADDKVAINCAEDTNPTPAPTVTSSAEPTETPQVTHTPSPTNTPEPTATTIAGDPIEPYAGAPYCDEINVTHDNRAWHGVWNYDAGCKWGHEHKRNPHDLDHIFGTEIYDLMGGEISYPWQTFNIFDPETLTYNYYAMPTASTVFENDAKHQGNGWVQMSNGRIAQSGSLLLGANWVDTARVHMHQIGGEAGALTRFHSFTQEVISCPSNVTLTDSDVVTRDNLGECGYAAGGGWLDFGRLNYPARGDYAELPGDPAIFGDFGLVGVPEAEPYRIHSTGQNSLDSWQSEGNKWVDGLDVDNMLQFGFGVHFLQGESPGETNPDNFLVPASERDTHFWCLDPVTGELTCGNDSSAAALFRVWVTVPRALDGGQYDEDGTVNNRFTFHGYTDRYGVIVTGCTELGLDCVPTTFENFPIGGCNSGFCKSAYRGGVGDGWDATTVDGVPGGESLFPNGERFIKYPN